MKFNYKNTALGLLENMAPDKFRIIDDGGETTMQEKINLGLSIVRTWEAFKPRFKKRVRYITQPFYDAYVRGCYKMKDVLDAEELDESGVLIFKASPSETNTIFYSLQTKGKGRDYEMDATVLIFNNDTHEDKPALGIVSQRRPNMPGAACRFYGSKAALKADISPMGVIADILTMVLFFKYCEIETKVVSGGKKGRLIDTKYVNDTKSDIEVMASPWFTTLVNSESFHVRGHLHWYYYGPNKSLKKLQWVDTYEKNGYTRQAKILSQ